MPLQCYPGMERRNSKLGGWVKELRLGSHGCFFLAEFTLFLRWNFQRGILVWKYVHTAGENRKPCPIPHPEQPCEPSLRLFAHGGLSVQIPRPILNRLPLFSASQKIPRVSIDAAEFSDVVFKTAPQNPKNGHVQSWHGNRIKNEYDSHGTD